MLSFGAFIHIGSRNMTKRTHDESSSEEESDDGIDYFAPIELGEDLDEEDDYEGSAKAGEFQFFFFIFG